MTFDEIISSLCENTTSTTSSTTSAATSTSTTSTLPTSTTTSTTPCSVEIGDASPDITTDDVSLFSPGSLPAGYYVISYVRGAMKYNGSGDTFRVNKDINTGFRLVFSGGSEVEAPGNYTGFASQAGVEADNAGAQALFLHTGGTIGVYLKDTVYTGHVPGTSANPTYHLAQYCPPTTTTTTTTAAPTTTTTTTGAPTTTTTTTYAGPPTTTTTTTTADCGTEPGNVLATIELNSATGAEVSFGSYAAGTYRIKYKEGAFQYYEGAWMVSCGLALPYVIVRAQSQPDNINFGCPGGEEASQAAAEALYAGQYLDIVHVGGTIKMFLYDSYYTDNTRGTPDSTFELYRLCPDGPTTTTTTTTAECEWVWEAVYVGGTQSYGGISLGDVFDGGTTITSCPGEEEDELELPEIVDEDGIPVPSEITFNGVPNCSGPGTHQVMFRAVSSCGGHIQ